VSYDILWYDKIASVRMVETAGEISTVGRMRNLETDSRIIEAQLMSLLYAP
jgi:hypothetical protein